MSDDLWQRDEIESPCQKICVMHTQSGLCIGCFRTRDEIARWSVMNPAERRAIMDELPSRAPHLKNKRSGLRRRRKPS